MNILYGYLISRFWRDSISRGFIFIISIGKYEKKGTNFRNLIKRSQLFFHFHKKSELLKFLGKLEQANELFAATFLDII